MHTKWTETHIHTQHTQIQLIQTTHKYTLIHILVHTVIHTHTGKHTLGQIIIHKHNKCEHTYTPGHRYTNICSKMHASIHSYKKTHKHINTYLCEFILSKHTHTHNTLICHIQALTLIHECVFMAVSGVARCFAKWPP